MFSKKNNEWSDNVIKKIKNFLKKILKPEYIPITKLEGFESLLKDNVALITGGSGGIGFAIAKELISCGCKVIITGRDEKKLADCCAELGKNAKFVVLDQSNIKKFDLKIEEIIKIFGKIDILVNSSGSHITRKDMNFFNIAEEEYDNVIDLNLKGTYFITQKIANYMIKNNIKGHILFISSSRGREPIWSPYQLSKLSMIGLTEGLAQQLAPYGIIVNGIAPGPTATKLIDFKDGDSIFTDDTSIKRYTMPEEVACYVKILVSNLGNTIVGQTIYMSGGRGIFDIR